MRLCCGGVEDDEAKAKGGQEWEERAVAGAVAGIGPHLGLLRRARHPSPRQGW